MFFIFFIPVAFLLSAALAHYTDTTFLLILFGFWLLFIQPGLLVVRIFFGRYFSRIAESLLALPVSIALTGVAVLVLFGKVGLPFTFISVVTILAAFNIVAAAVALYTKGISFRPSRVFSFSWNDLLPFLVVGGVFLVVHGINILLYPYLPEADSYALIQKIQEAHKEASVQQFQYRPLFLQLVSAITLITKIDPLVFFRWIVPCVLVGVSFFGVLVARESGSTRAQQILAGLVLLSVPVIFQESEYVRSQSPIILFSATVMWLLLSWRRTQNVELWVLATILSVVGFAFHEFSIFLLVACVLVQIPFYIRMLRTNAKSTVWLTLAVLVMVYPTLGSLVRGGIVGRIIYDVVYNFKNLHFDFWFIDSYVNSDGNNLGWPGLQAFLYYGYNLGILLPILLFFWLWSKNLLSTLHKNIVTVGLVFLSMPFIFAEVLPRFGLAYLPDRAWLYVALGLSFVGIALVQRLSVKMTHLFIGVALLSTMVTPLLTYLKQGWITRSEHKAAMWIRENTDPTSVIYAQVGSIEPLIVYSNRLAIDGRALYESGGDLENTTQVIDDALADYARNQNEAEQAFFTAIETGGNQKILNAKLLTFVNSRRAYRAYVPFKNKVTLAKERYITYSTDKFQGVYGSREWWRNLNSAGIELSFLDNTDQFELVFSEGGTRIWKEK